jgi:hypothetical protein
MMILAIAVSTMIVVALVVFATQFCVYRKNQAKRDKACTRERLAGDTQEAPIAS